MSDQAIYEETQRLHHNAIVRYVVPISCIFSVGLALAVMLARNASTFDLLLVLGIGLGVPLLLSMLPMRTVVTEEAITVRSIYLFGTRVPTADVFEASDARYNPMLDCGGWGGARPSRKYGIVYNIAGDRGVHVRYRRDGTERSMLIGSRRSEELARAIRLAANLPGEEAVHGVAPT